MMVNLIYCNTFYKKKYWQNEITAVDEFRDCYFKQNGLKKIIFDKKM